jgi:hypothetical protein
MQNIHHKITTIFKKKSMAIFCGAGISFLSGLPLAIELKKYILQQLPINHDDIDSIISSNLPFESIMESLSDNSDISKILEIFRQGK